MQCATPGCRESPFEASPGSQVFPGTLWAGTLNASRHRSTGRQALQAVHPITDQAQCRCTFLLDIDSYPYR